MFLRLFENFVKFPFYSLSFREIRHYSPRFPLRGKWRAAPIEVYLKFRLMLRLPLASIKFCLQNFFRQKWESFPYVKASPCFFLLSQKTAKLVSRYAASPRGEAPPRGGGGGRNLFSIRIISIKGCNLFVSPSLSPSGTLVELPF